MTKFPVEKPVLVTCGLPYANGRAHIGHLRTYIPADVFVRSLRKQGQEVAFICGSDTHGTPIVVNAEEQGMRPDELWPIYHEHFQQVFKQLGIDFDIYGHTDSKLNHNRTNQLVQELIDRDYVYPRVIELAYCPECEQFLPDRYVEGKCPRCGEPARGDECDQGCGAHLEPGDILEATCKRCGTKANYREQEHYFFKLSYFQDFLLNYLKNLEGTSNALNYALGWVDQDLHDWCITRNMDWGVPFPRHEDLVVYVWVDAPIGYMSFTEEWAMSTGKDWERIWRGDSRIIHFIGGDIVYHHCIFWPAMLEGSGYTLPWAVVASGMLKIEGKTFSKSRGYVVWVDEDYLDHGFHPDLLRYYLTSYTSHTKELNFSWDLFQDKVNNELVGALGNYIYRVLSFTDNNFGQVPRGDLDAEVIERIEETKDEFIEAMDNWEFKAAVDVAMSLADYGNQYFQGNEPWKLIKEDREAAGEVLRNCLQIVKALTLLLEPVLPAKMETAWHQLGMKTSIHDATFVDLLVEVPAGQHLGQPEILFNRVEDEKIEEMEEILEERIAIAEKRQTKEEVEEAHVSYEEFQRMDIRVGEVVDAEQIEGAEKLLKLVVDIGELEPRQVVAGIAKTHDPEHLLGRRVVVLANMEPTRFFGVESRGMLLAADVDGEPYLLEVEEDVEPGTKIK